MLFKKNKVFGVVNVLSHLTSRMIHVCGSYRELAFLEGDELILAAVLMNPKCSGFELPVDERRPVQGVYLCDGAGMVTSDRFGLETGSPSVRPVMVEYS